MTRAMRMATLQCGQITSNWANGVFLCTTQSRKESRYASNPTSRRSSTRSAFRSAQALPLRMPTHNSAAVDPSPVLCADKYIDECRYERGAIATQQVSHIKSSQLLHRIVLEENQIYIGCHAQCPVRIDAEEPKCR